MIQIHFFLMSPGLDIKIYPLGKTESVFLKSTFPIQREALAMTF